MAIRAFRGVFFSLITSIAYAIQMLVITVILSRYASSESFGAFGYALALLTPLLLLFNLNLRTLILTDSPKKHAAQGDYFVLTILLTAGFLLVSLVAAWMHSGEIRLMIVGASVLKAVEMLTSISTASNYKRYRTDLVAICQVARTLVVVVAFSLVFSMTKSIWISLLIAGIASLMLYVLFDWQLTTLKGRVKWTSFSVQNLRALKFSLISIGLVATIPVINALLQNTPRYVLNNMGDLSGVAVITVLMYAAMPGNLALMSLSSVLTPRLNAHWNAGARAAFTRESLLAVSGAVLMGLCILLGGWFLGEWAVTTVFTVEYAGYGTELRLMLAGAVVWYACTMLTVSVVAGRGYMTSLVASALGTATVLVVYLWVPQGTAGDISWALMLYVFGMLVRFMGLLAGFLWLLPQCPLVPVREASL